MDGVFDRLKAMRAEIDALLAESIDTLSHREILAALQECETQDRLRPVFTQRLLARLTGEARPQDLGATTWAKVLSAALRISPDDARRRLNEANDLAPRRALTGEPLEPRLAATAAAQARGDIGAEHITIIRTFLKDLPGHIDATTRCQGEATLAGIAPGLDPPALKKAAAQLTLMLDQDGEEPHDADRARKRGITVGPQQSDGMSKISGFIDPELRAAWEAVTAAWAAPGRCNPDDENPCIDDDPGEAIVQQDLRSARQRNHDALKAVLRAILASGKLGQHNGLPATIIVSTTLAELESGAGQAVTGGGSLMPMSDLIRLAAHSHHYLAVFDTHTNVPLYLGRSKRLASPGQRIVLHARDRGCTKPGCPVPGYWSQVHHINGWAADNGETNITDLTLACGPDNRLIEHTGWTTRTRRDGRTEWIPPPALDTGQTRVNDYHHPQNYLAENNSDTAEEGEDPG